MKIEEIESRIDAAINKLLSVKNDLLEGFNKPTPTSVTEDNLKQVLLTDMWPQAILPTLICNPDSESEKISRAEGVVELILEEEMDGKKVLDFGCGEGYTTAYMARKNLELAVGYDLISTQIASQEPRLLFTDSFELVLANAPYDYILLFDVLDHLMQEQPAAVLRKLAAILKPDGRIYARMHPYVSRHAMHHYHHLNKAFISLVFTYKELKQLIPNQKHVLQNHGPIFPIITYQKYFNEAGLQELSRREYKDPVEPFFQNNCVAQRIKANLQVEDLPIYQMSLSMIDYCLGLA